MKSFCPGLACLVCHDRTILVDKPCIQMQENGHLFRPIHQVLQSTRTCGDEWPFFFCAAFCYFVLCPYSQFLASPLLFPTPFTDPRPHCCCSPAGPALVLADTLKSREGKEDHCRGFLLVFPCQVAVTPLSWCPLLGPRPRRLRFSTTGYPYRLFRPPLASQLATCHRTESNAPGIEARGGVRTAQEKQKTEDRPERKRQTR